MWKQQKRAKIGKVECQNVNKASEWVSKKDLASEKERGEIRDLDKR